MSSIGFIGAGHIAAPMARHLAAKGHNIIVSERNAGTAANLAKTVGARVLGNQQVLDACDIVFLCVRPHVAPGLLQGLSFRADHRVVSVMAGVPLSFLQDHCAPAREFTITIPLGFLEGGGCPLPAFPNDTLLAALFAPENPVLQVTSEAALNQHFAICALVPGLLDLMATASGWLTERTGDAAAAEAYTTQLVAGFLGAMPKDAPGQLARERNALATVGSLSLQMTTTLHETGAHDSILAGLSAIGTRLETPE